MYEKTDINHWDKTWTRRPRPRLPSGLAIGTRNVQRVLQTRIRPGMNVLEIGCAPGKMLAWVSRALGARISGLDYSPRGLETTRWLLSQMNIEADLRQENVFETSFEPETFDVVYSNGVIEHFDDPRDIVFMHVRLLRPGGRAVILIPNYGGVYGRLQSAFDPENLSIHNLGIMNEMAMGRLAPPGEDIGTQVYRAGRFSPWLVSWERRWGRAGHALSWMINGLALLQPFEIGRLCPLLILEIRREGDLSHATEAS